MVMAKVFYPAVLERGSPSGFGLYFPDLPGCVSTGVTAESAARRAADALAMHIQGMVEDGEELPSPSALTELLVDPEVDEFARVLVGVVMA